MELDSLGTSVWVFEQNYLELRILGEQILSAESSIRLTVRNNRMLFDLYMYQLTQRLHNFVASVASLVDHTRRVYRRNYQAKGLFPEYQGEIGTRFGESPLVQFVQGLRDYMLHYRLPGIALETNILDLQTERMAHRLTISKETLLDFDWNAKAKEFIQTRVGKSVDILQATDDYHAAVAKFQEWFGSKQREIHRDDFELVSRAQEEYLRLMAPEVPVAISERLQFLPRLGTVFNVLGVYLTRAQEAEIAHLVGNPVAWTEGALQRIQKNVPLPSGLVERTIGFARSLPSAQQVGDVKR